MGCGNSKNTLNYQEVKLILLKIQKTERYIQSICQKCTQVNPERFKNCKKPNPVALSFEIIKTYVQSEEDGEENEQFLEEKQNKYQYNNLILLEYLRLMYDNQEILKQLLLKAMRLLAKLNGDRESKYLNEKELKLKLENLQDISLSVHGKIQNSKEFEKKNQAFIKTNLEINNSDHEGDYQECYNSKIFNQQMDNNGIVSFKHIPNNTNNLTEMERSMNNHPKNEPEKTNNQPNNLNKQGDKVIINTSNNQETSFKQENNIPVQTLDQIIQFTAHSEIIC